MERSEAAALPPCRAALTRVVGKYGWRGNWDEEAFVEEILAEAQARQTSVRRKTPEQIAEDAATFCYSRRWYAACRADDAIEQRAAFEALWQYVYRASFQRVRRNHEIAQEVTQEALLSIWRSLDTVREPGAFINFVQLTFIRQGWRTMKQAGQEEAEEADDDLLDTQPELAPPPHDETESSDLRAEAERVVRRCLRRSKARQKVIIDSLLNNRSLNDIAAEMGKTPNAVSVLKHRALDQLRQCPEMKEFQKMVEETERPEAEEPSQAVQHFLNVVAGAADSMDCEECLAWLPEYVEAEVSGFDVVERYPEVKRHLDLCRTCEQTYVALLESALQEREAGAPDVDAPPADLPFLPPVSFQEYVQGLALRVAGGLNPVWLPHVQTMAADFLRRVLALGRNQPLPQFAPAMDADAPERQAVRLLATTYDATRTVAGDLSDAEIEAQIQQGALAQTLQAAARSAAAHQGFSDEEARQFVKEYVEVVCRTPSLLRDVARQSANGGDS